MRLKSVSGHTPTVTYKNFHRLEVSCLIWQPWLSIGFFSYNVEELGMLDILSRSALAKSWFGGSGSTIDTTITPSAGSSWSPSDTSASEGPEICFTAGFSLTAGRIPAAWWEAADFCFRREESPLESSLRGLSERVWDGVVYEVVDLDEGRILLWYPWIYGGEATYRH